MDSDQIVAALVLAFFRKPEVFKYAKAELLSYQKVLDGKLTDMEYHEMQSELYLEAMNGRTEDELKGHIRLPSWWERFKYSLGDNLGQ